MMFDFLCYSIYNVFRNINYNSPEFAASSTVSALQTTNISGIAIYYGNLTENFYFTKPFVLITYGILVVANYIRYIRIDRFSIDSIRKRWNMKSSNYQENSKLLQNIYVIVSILLFVGLLVWN